MRLCIPATKDEGVNSPVCEHFGSAPVFVVVDTETGAHTVVANRDLHHAHGMCQPLRSLQDRAIDALAVGGIGRAALQRLQSAGIRVLLARERTVADVCAAFGAGRLSEATLESACGHHGSGPHGPHGGHGPHGPCGGAGPLRS